MFTGIIETIGQVVGVTHQQNNLDIIIQSSISNELKIDQSVSHNGVCLTVVAVSEHTHRVTAIEETLQKTNLTSWKPGTWINLERAMTASGRFDGHLVQGHIDQTATITQIEKKAGSWLFTFQYDPPSATLVVNKGSICIDGVSLTVINPSARFFQVAIIPYTYQHTIFQYYKLDDTVNIEFDIIGKYVAAQWQAFQEHLS